MKQRRKLAESEIQQIVNLLKRKDLSMFHIAAMLGCTRLSVYKINTKYDVRTCKRETQQQTVSV